MSLFAEFYRRLLTRPDRADIALVAFMSAVGLWAGWSDGHGWWSPVLAAVVGVEAWAFTRFVIVLVERLTGRP